MEHCIVLGINNEQSTLPALEEFTVPLERQTSNQVTWIGKLLQTVSLVKLSKKTKVFCRWSTFQWFFKFT